MANDDRLGIDSDNDDEAIEFATYVESDDDDEDPFYMAEHNKKSSTLSFLRLSCSPIQLVQVLVPTICILIIIVYTIVVAVLTHNKRNINPT